MFKCLLLDIKMVNCVCIEVELFVLKLYDGWCIWLDGVWYDRVCWLNYGKSDCDIKKNFIIRCYFYLNFVELEWN